MTQKLHNRAIGYFDAVRRYGSIREAARRLDIAASAVNRHILTLEADVGMPLFDRRNDGMVLTAAGEVLARHAVAVLQDERRAAEELRALIGLRRGVLSLMAVESLGVSFLPDLVERMAALYPGIKIKAGLAGSDAVAASVADGDADVGLGFSLPRHSELERVAEGRFKLRAVMRPDHPLAKRERLTFSDCAQYPLIMPRADLSLHALLTPLQQRHRGAIEVMAEVSSLILMRQLTLRTGAICFQTRLALEEELKEGRLMAVPLQSGGPVITELGVFVRAGRGLPGSVSAFLALAGESLAQIAAEEGE
jgi:DNA-binding transcriptional LysR family regulator